MKKTYLVGETVLVKYELTSLVDGTLCFPPPALEAQQSVTGYVATVAKPATVDDDGDRFMEHFWEKHPDEERLRSDVATRWVKLGMSEPYKPKIAGKVTVLTQPGEWVLRSTYHPPQLSSNEKAIIESLGCTPTSVEVPSAPITITVLDAPK